MIFGGLREVSKWIMFPTVPFLWIHLDQFDLVHLHLCLIQWLYYFLDLHLCKSATRIMGWELMPRNILVSWNRHLWHGLAWGNDQKCNSLWLWQGKLWRPKCCVHGYLNFLCKHECVFYVPSAWIPWRTLHKKLLPCGHHHLQQKGPTNPIAQPRGCFVVFHHFHYSRISRRVMAECVRLKGPNSGGSRHDLHKIVYKPMVHNTISPPEISFCSKAAWIPSSQLLFRYDGNPWRFDSSSTWCDLLRLQKLPASTMSLVFRWSTYKHVQYMTSRFTSKIWQKYKTLRLHMQMKKTIM